MPLTVLEDSFFIEVLKSFWQHFSSAFNIKERLGEIGPEINEGILQVQKFFTVGGKEFVLTDAVIVTWIAVFICIVLFLFAVRKVNLIPSTGQTIVEMLVGLIISSAMGFGLNRKQAEKIAPTIGTFGIVIMACNVSSLFKLSPPAKNIAFPVALAIVAIIYVIGVSISMVGIKGFWSSLIHPMPAMLPFKLLDYIIKPVSLSLRLFGNVFGAFVFMEFLDICIPIIVPGLFSLWFDIVDAILQAVVFAYLTMSYIGEIVETANEIKENPPEKKKKKKKEVQAAA